MVKKFTSIKLLFSNIIYWSNGRICLIAIRPFLFGNTNACRPADGGCGTLKKICDP